MTLDAVLTIRPEAHHRGAVGHKFFGDGETKAPWRSVFYFCPACKETHNADLDENGRKTPKWTWNGDLVNPSVQPSVNYSSRVCHHVIDAGSISYCEDCTHPLRGQRVMLPTIAEWPEFFRGLLGIGVMEGA